MMTTTSSMLLMMTVTTIESALEYRDVQIGCKANLFRLRAFQDQWSGYYFSS